MQFINRIRCSESSKQTKFCIPAISGLLAAVIISMPFAHEIHDCDGIIESDDCPVYMLQKSLNSDTSILSPLLLFLSCVFFYRAIIYSLEAIESISAFPIRCRAPPYNQRKINR